MVKGCQRQMVILKCASDSAFENAYFILKNEKQRSFSEEEIISQANKIISENCFSRAKKKKAKTAFLLIASFLCGALLASAATALVLMLYY